MPESWDDAREPRSWRPCSRRTGRARPLCTKIHTASTVRTQLSNGNEICLCCFSGSLSWKRLTEANKWEGWSVRTPAAGTGLWQDLQNLRGRQKDFRSSQLCSWNTRKAVLTAEAEPLLPYHWCAFGWWSPGGRLPGPKLLRSSLHREMCPRGGILPRPREEKCLNINSPSKSPGKINFPRLLLKWVPVLCVVVKTWHGKTLFCVNGTK